MNRKARRSQISEFILHSKSFIKEKDNLKETILDDGSIKFYIEGFASTEVQDGSGDIVKVDGIDTSRYENNPVLQRGHKRGSENTIGKIIKLEKVPGQGLYIGAEIILNPEIEDHKVMIHGLRHGLINGFSIGFNEVSSRYDDMLNANVIEKLMLYEISLVDIPDNPLTVRKFIDKIISKEADVEETEEETDDEETDETIEDDKGCGKKPKKTTKEVEEGDETVEEVVETNENAVVTVEEVVETVEEKEEVVVVSQEEENAPEKTDEEENIEEKPETVEEVVETVEEVIDETPEVVIEEQKPIEGDIVPEVVEADLGKEAKTKALGTDGVAVGDMVMYRSKYSEPDGETYVYPEMKEKAYIGYVFGIKKSGTLMKRGEPYECTEERPFIFILKYVEINGALIPTYETTICRFDEVFIESKYEGEAKAVKHLETKELEILQDIPTTTDDNGNVIKVETDEESEKSSGNALKIKTLGEEKANVEKMCLDMISANETLLGKVNKLEAQLNKFRKTKATVGLHFEGEEAIGNTKLGSIVQMIRDSQ